MSKFPFPLGSPPLLHTGEAQRSAIESMASSLRAAQTAKRKSCHAAIGHLVDAAASFGEALAHRRTGWRTGARAPPWVGESKVQRAGPGTKSWPARTAAPPGPSRVRRQPPIGTT